MRRAGRAVLWAGLVTSLAGCGAAYYGAGIAIFATQGKKKTTDLSFPDAHPTAATAPAFATLELSGSQITVERTGAGAFITPDTPAGDRADVSGDEVIGVTFPPGFGEALSNRDTGTRLEDGDRLVVRINRDDAKELTFAAADFATFPGGVATVGSAVAAAIEAKVQTLTPSQSAVASEAYTAFTATYDATTGSYRFVSGAPGEDSEVVWEPAPRTGFGDAAPDAGSARVAERLGLGVANGGIEVGGGDSVRVTVINHGTDVIPAGTIVDLYLSQDKLLDPSRDVLFDRMAIDAPIQVGEARVYSRQNGGEPPEPLIVSDFPAGALHVLFSVRPSGGEANVDDNLAWTHRPVMVCLPAATGAAAIDYAVVETRAPISVVTGNTLEAAVTVSNFGDVVLTDEGTLDLDLALSSDRVLDEPAAFVDPDGVVAGVRINPRDPNRAVGLVIDDTGTGGAFQATLSGGTLTFTYDPSDPTPPTVKDFINLVNASPNGLVDAFHDGVSDPDDHTLADLVAAAGTGPALAKDVFVATRRVFFPATSKQQHTRTYFLGGTVRQQGFVAAQLPLKLFPLYRVRSAAAGENDANNVRQGRNFVRVYDRARAAFDPDTGSYLPTVNDDDFSRLEAVSQRPVNSGSIRQGQQRIFSFEIPSTGLLTDESQILIILRTDDDDGFDAHLDLLSASGKLVAQSDDTALGTDPVVFTPAFANTGSRTFYVVVAPATFRESDLSGAGESFELTLSVNARESTDPGLVKGVGAFDLARRTPQQYAAPEANLRNDVLVPFSMVNGEAEVMFLLPRRARVKLRSRPVFTVSVDTEITRFVAEEVPSPVEFQPELTAAGDAIVYRPTGGDSATSLILDPGVYTVAFDSRSGAADNQDLRLEVDTEYFPEDD